MNLVKSFTVAALCILTQVALAQTPDQKIQAFTAPKRWAMVIGISGYKKIGALQYPAKDAQAFSEVLQSSYGFEKQNVNLLTQDESSLIDLSASDIYSSLDKQLSQKTLDRGDLFVFYFSGHGVGTPSGDYLMPASADANTPETTGLSFQRILDRIVAAKLKNVLIIVDACRQGKKNPFGSNLVELGRKSDIAVLLGCEPGGRSYEMPRFGQGLFTYSLIQAIKDETLLDETSGALWASTLAKRVQNDVKSRSLREFGPGEEQIPAVWTERTQDVLLGAFVGRGELTQKAMEILKETFGKVDRESYAKYLLGMGLVAFQAGKVDMAIELWTTLRDLGGASDDLLILMATVFSSVGREAEAEKIYADLWKTSKNQDTLDDIALAWDSAEITPTRRVEAAERQWSKNKSFADAQTLYSTLYSAKLNDRLLQWLPKIIAEFGPDTEAGLYFTVWLHVSKGEFSAALDPLNKGLSKTNDRIKTDRESPPEAHDWFIQAVTCFDALDNTGAGDRIVAVGKKDPKHGEYWAAIELMRIMNARDKNELEKTKKELENCKTVDQLWQLVRLAGSQLPQLKTEFTETANRFPDAGRARLIKWFVEWSEDWKSDLNPPDSVRALYASDDLLTDDIADLIVNSYKVFTEIPKSQRDHAADSLLQNYTKRLDKIDLNGPAFGNFEQLIAIADRYFLAGEVAQRILLPRVLAGKTTGKCPRLTLQYLISFGDFDGAEKVYKNQEKFGAADSELRITWAVALTLLNRSQEAIEVIKNITPPADEYSKNLFLAASALILSKAGDQSAINQLDNHEFKTAATAGMVAIARFDKGDVNQLATGLFEGVSAYDDRFLIVQYACAERLIYGLRQLETQNPGNIAPIIENIQISLRDMPDAPIFDQIKLWDDLKPFIGNHQYTAFNTAEPESLSQISLEVMANGKTTIKVTGKDGNITDFTGTCTKEGIVIATSTKPGERANIRLRLAPIKLSEDWKNANLSGSAWNAKGDHSALTLRPTGK